MCYLPCSLLNKKLLLYAVVMSTKLGFSLRMSPVCVRFTCIVSLITAGQQAFPSCWGATTDRPQPSAPLGIVWAAECLAHSWSLPRAAYLHTALDRLEVVKAWPRLLNSGRFWRAISASELSVELTEASTETESQLDRSPCLVCFLPLPSPRC